MARRDLSGAVDFSVLEDATGGDAAISEEVLALFVEQAGIWSPLLERGHAGWRDAAHTLRGAAAGIGAGDLATACGAAEAGQGEMLSSVRNELDRALVDVAAFRHELALKSLKG